MSFYRKLQPTKKALKACEMEVQSQSQYESEDEEIKR